MQGIIIKGVGGLYHVKTENSIIKCKARGKFRYDSIVPMVGDKVKICNEEGIIEKIYERENELIRPVVANVTQAFVVFTLKNPNLNQDLLCKFLVLCEFNNLKIVLCINKIDLANENDLKKVNMFKKAGYDILYTNAKDGTGLEELKKRVSNNISVFCGPSGVGKSTLLNNLVGRNAMQTGDISSKLKRGKHTTRHSELIECSDGYLVDTPGFSSLEMSFIDEEQLQYCFPEFKSSIGECKFSNCMHHKEPGCKIKELVNEDIIDKERYNFYVKTFEELKNRRNNKW